MSRKFLIASVCLLGMLKAEAAAAQSEPPAEDGRTRARQIAGQGDTEFASGRCDRAIRLWKEADAVFSATTIELRIAHCQALVGHVVDAAATMDAIVNKTLPPDAPEPFVTAKEQAAAELPALRARIATLELAAPAGAEVWIDEEKRPPNLRGYAVDPGRHRIRIQKGAEVGEKVVDLGDGEKRTLTVSTFLEKPPPTKRPGRTAGFILGGSGIAVLGVGSVLGVLALSQSAELDDRCGPSHTACPPEDQEKISGLKSKALAANLVIGAGAALLATGGFLLWQSTRTDQAPGRVRLKVSGLGAGLDARF
jgi:hypothetical protein